MSREPKNTGNEQKTVKPKVRALLNKYDWYWWANAAGPYGKTGLADTHAFKAGVFIAVESKWEGGGHKLSARQIGHLNSISAEAGFAFAVNQHNLPQLEIFLKNFAIAAAMVQKGEQVGSDKGGPMLDAIRALTDYPVSVEAYAQEKERKRAEVEDELDNHNPVHNSHSGDAGGPVLGSDEQGG